jgi:hypothetical protein
LKTNDERSRLDQSSDLPDFHSSNLPTSNHRARMEFVI